MQHASAVTIAARLDRLPRSRHVRRLIALISLGGCFEYYDLFFTAYVAPGLTRSGIFTATTQAFFGLEGMASFVAALFAGLFVGTFAFSFLSDRLGRRAVFTYSLLWYSVATLIMAFQNDAISIDLWRFIASIGIGVELVNTDTYVSELVPKERRGAAFGYNQFVMFLAVPLVAFLSWLLVPIAPFGIDGWRWVVLIGASGAVFIWWIRLAVPESPRWLAQQGRADEADRIMQVFEAATERETGQPLPPPEIVQGEPEDVEGSWFEMWRKPYLGRTLMMIVYNLFQTVGYYGFSSWVPTLLISQGITVTKSLEYTFIIAIAAPIGPLVGILVSDRFERKWQIAWAAAAIALFGVLFSQQTTSTGILVLGILITLANNWLSFSFHAFQTELYPTRIRARAVGFVYSWSRFSAIFTSFIIAFFLGRYGTTGVFVLIAACMAVVFGVIGGFGPRTSRLRLEAIAK